MQKIETAYLFDLYDTYLKKSIDRLKLNSMQLARVVKECSDDKLNVFFKNVRKKNSYLKFSIKKESQFLSFFRLCNSAIFIYLKRNSNTV